MMAGRRVTISGALLAALGIALGAFGAHGLRDSLDPMRLGWWQTAVDYQLWNAVGLIAVARLPSSALPAVLIGCGVLVFSGTLHAMALTGLRWLGAVTPIGGLLMIAGWLLLAWRVRGTQA